MRPVRLPTLSREQITELDEFYHTTRHARLRTRAQIVLLAAEQRLVAAEIGSIVRLNEHTVRRWLKRYTIEGLNGLLDVPRPGRPPKVTPAYQQRLLQLVRQRPRALGQPFSLWTTQRLAEVLAEETGIRVDAETVRRHLAEAGIVLSRPQHTISSPDPEYMVKKRRLKAPATP
jgi:transposase